MNQLQPNWDANNDFWHFVNERHRIYEKKEIDELPKPWTDDPILRDWKFCNVFRHLDMQSKLLINELAQHQITSEPGHILFNIFLFRAFNCNPTYQLFGWQTTWLPWAVKQALYLHCSEQNNKLTSGAYMIRGREGMPKYESIIMTLTDIWEARDELAQRIWYGHTIKNATESILDKKFWGWADFTSYQVVLDLMHTIILRNPWDVNTWTCFGPGAKKGLREIWPELPLKQEWMLEAAKTLLVDQVKYREPHVPELTLQDIEFCLCELSKYRKIKAGGKGKARYDGRA